MITESGTPMNLRLRILSMFSLLLAISCTSSASVFSTMKVIVHDPQHRPLRDAQVKLESTTSDLKLDAKTDADGVATILNVPLGYYRINITASGFGPQLQDVSIGSGTLHELHFQLSLATVEQSVEVNETTSYVNPSSTSPTTLIGRADIAQTPGVDRTNSLSVITDFVPGAYMVHDQLHIRGGHQVTWAIDGIPVPNTNISSNVGPQFDPKDIDYLEVQRGAYSAEFGDRTYGVFNVVTRSGFERSREGEVATSYGTHNFTDNQVSLGSHSDRFAWYFSANGNRSDYGLETPTFDVLHDEASGGGGFTSLIFNASPKDQLRFVGSLRGDSYQVPNDPDAQAAGVSDREREQDAFGNFSWIRTLNAGTVFTIAPFYHFNRAAFEGGALDVPSATDNRASHYAGGQASLGLVKAKHNAKVGVYAFGQHDETLFQLNPNDGSAVLSQREKASGQLLAAFIEDQFKPTSWLTLNGGIRLTHFSGAISEDAPSPRIGVAIQLPRLNWILRGAYSRYYQAPPLNTISGPLLEVAVDQGFGFLPLRGERDEQYDFGVTVPVKGWVTEVDYFRTSARNFFDHDVIGNSNIFFPLTIDSVRIRGTEVTLRSPLIWKRANVHLAYSHQSVEGRGGISGGLTDFSLPEEGFFFLDHDQRNTLTTGFRAGLPWRSWMAANFAYGSGFLNGDGPEHLPSYSTVDLSVGKSFGENWSASVSATNLTNKRYFIDLSNTFGGSHVGDPRIVAVQVKYRFHF
jgi:outer membrane receptor protein involved in Fe transport